MSKPYYLAGPMSNLPQSNFPAFDDAARDLRARGYDIVSPAELDDHEERAAILQGIPHNQSTWGTYLSRDIKIVIDEAQGIIFLPDWIKSRGAQLEAFAALKAGHHLFANYYKDVREQPLRFVSRQYVAELLAMHIV